MSRSDVISKRATSSERKPFDPQVANKPHLSGFPAHHQLIVTTKRSVSLWEGPKAIELFHSGSGGIVAAKRLEEDSNMIAVADSQVVVLHDVRRKKQKSYRLKGSEVIIPTCQVVIDAERDRAKSDLSSTLVTKRGAFSLPRLCRTQSKPSL